MKIKDILNKGIEILKENNIDDSSLKAKLLLSKIINKSKEYLMIYDNEEITKKQEETFFQKIEKIEENVPIQYVINSQEFMGLDFYVDENVLIPQPDTEILVQEVLEIANKKNKEIKILDLCTGSGAIGISLAKLVENSKVFVSDISLKALEIAKQNSIKNNCEIKIIQSDLFNQIKENKLDIIVSNPPYIETDVINTLSEEVKKEPMLALDGGKDGLEFYRKIIKSAKEFLKENGYLCLEIGYNQKLEVMKLLEENGYKNIYSKKDLGENDRIVVAQI